MSASPPLDVPANPGQRIAVTIRRRVRLQVKCAASGLTIEFVALVGIDPVITLGSAGISIAVLDDDQNGAIRLVHNADREG